MDSRRRKRGEGTPKYDYDLVEGKKDDREFDKFVDVTVEYGGVQTSPVAEHGVEGAEVDNDVVEGVNEAVREEVNELVSEPVNEAIREKVNEPVNEPVADVIAVNTQPEMDFDEANLYVQLPIVEPVKEPVIPTRPKIPFIRKKTAAIKAPGLKKPIAAVMKKKPFTRSSAQFISKFHGNENEPLEID
nr:putative membrane protein [Ipomoea batatas]